jgi:hypothetical protein
MREIGCPLGNLGREVLLIKGFLSDPIREYAATTGYARARIRIEYHMLAPAPFGSSGGRERIPMVLGHVTWT